MGRALAGGLCALGVASPLLVGVVTVSDSRTVSALIGVASAVAGVLAVAGRQTGKRAVAVAALLALSISTADVASRPFLTPHLYYERLEPWPAAPWISRYVPDLSTRGTTFGGLALMSGRPEYRQQREMRFVTDAYGLRNEAGDPARVDVVVLGDSFGVGDTTTQGQTWPRLLAQRSGLSVYNLSVSATGPSQQYVNLALEIDRLRRGPHAVVLWMIYVGNDLDDPVLPIRDDAIHPQGRFMQMLRRVRNFRARGSIAALLRRPDFGSNAASALVERTFLDGRTSLFLTLENERAKRTEAEVDAHPNYVALRGALAAMRRLTEREGIALVLVLAPTKGEVYSWVLDRAAPWSASPAPSGFSVALRAAAAELGLCLVDLKPELIAASRRVFEDAGDVLYYHDDTHWTARGNEEVATLLERELCLGSGREVECCLQASRSDEGKVLGAGR